MPPPSETAHASPSHDPCTATAWSRHRGHGSRVAQRRRWVQRPVRVGVRDKFAVAVGLLSSEEPGGGRLQDHDLSSLRSLATIFFFASSRGNDGIQTKVNGTNGFFSAAGPGSAARAPDGERKSVALASGSCSPPDTRFHRDVRGGKSL
jgi:hypothetical protein